MPKTKKNKKSFEDQAEQDDVAQQQMKPERGVEGGKKKRSEEVNVDRGKHSKSFDDQAEVDDAAKQKVEPDHGLEGGKKKRRREVNIDGEKNNKSFEDQAEVDDVAQQPVKDDNGLGGGKRKQRREVNVDGISAVDAQEPAVSGTPGKRPRRMDSDDPVVKEALSLILRGIAEPEAQKDGKAFVPPNWHDVYKPVLGPYKKFLLAHPDRVTLVEDGTGKFVIRRSDDVTSPQNSKPVLIKGRTWQKMVIDAWMAYCVLVKKEDRDFDEFIGPLPRGARTTTKGDKAVTSPVRAGTASVPESVAGAQEKKNKKKKKRMMETP